MWVFVCIYVYVPHVCLELEEVTKGLHIGSPGPVIIDGYELPSGCLR